jgi:ABC-type Zn uptake system ZnuABC Zn-binding protein ZnuA
MLRLVAVRSRCIALSLVLTVFGVAPALAQVQAGGGPLQVVATVPELGSLAREVGGAHVAVTVFVKGPEDPHFIEAKPSFVKSLSQADLYLRVGLEADIGWAPTLLQQARNANVLPGAPGYVDASTVITPLEVMSGPVDRSMGDVHPLGNPHYLVDPVQGLKVAGLIRDKLSALRPQYRADFEARSAAFRQRIGTAMVGEALARKYDVEKLALLFEHGRLSAFLQAQGEAGLLGGWLGRVLPYAGARAVSDHNVWPYFARRFGLTMVGFMEPRPGIPPTTKHLRELVQTMQTQGARLILASAYYDPRHAQFLAQNTGAKVVPLANQVGARAGTDDYLSMVDYNVRQLVTALGDGR